MIVGIGTDIVEIKRIAASLERFGERFQNRILTPDERRPDIDTGRLSAYLARQFAAKEAVAKALGTGMSGGVHFRNIEVLRNESGAPYVRLMDAAARCGDGSAVDEVMISISDEQAYAVAFAVALRSPGD